MHIVNSHFMEGIHSRFFVEFSKNRLTMPEMIGIMKAEREILYRIPAEVICFFDLRGRIIMKLRNRRICASLTAMALALGTLTCTCSLTASAADGAGGYSWEKTEGYHEGTDSVTNSGNQTKVTFSNADQDKRVAGFCTQDATGWDWSGYTQLSFTLTNESASDIRFEIALGTGANWDWYQCANGAQIGAGKSADLTYYLKSEEWSFDGSTTKISDLYQVHRINMMVMPAAEGAVVSGSVTVSDLKLGGSGSSEVTAKDGFYVDGSVLRDANRNPFVMRGTNYAYTWYSWDSLTADAFKEIAGYGANCIRIVLGDGQQYTKNSSGEIANLIELCEKNKLVAVFEVHDATGKDDADSLLTAAKYFANDIASALKGHEDTVIINIANEWQGSANDSAWQSAYIDAVKIIRNAGLTHCIMCDAGGWGQSASTVINGGAAVLAADPEHNTMFSVHMYGTAGGSESKIKTTIDSMITRELCLVIGEFGYTHSDGDVKEEYIMSYAQETATGWLAWSWYGNGSPVEYLDMSSANARGTLSSNWGEVVINGQNGWKATSKVCTVFTEEPQHSETTTTTTTTTTTITTTTETTTTLTETTTTVTETTESTVSSHDALLRGDTDCNGTVDVLDAVLLARVAAEDTSCGATDQGKQNADVTGDGTVKTDDLTTLLRYLAGILQTI